MPIRDLPRATRGANARGGDLYQLGLQLLARRELSIEQLRSRLRRRSTDHGSVDAAIARLIETGAVDDRRAAESYARTAHALKGRGRDRIRRELELMGIDRTVVAAAIDAVVPREDEGQLLERALDRQFAKTLTTDRLLRRAFNYLVRQGYSPDAARLAVARRRSRTFPAADD